MPVGPLPGAQIVGLVIDLFDLTGFLLVGSIDADDERRDAKDGSDAESHCERFPLVSEPCLAGLYERLLVCQNGKQINTQGNQLIQWFLSEPGRKDVKL